MVAKTMQLRVFVHLPPSFDEVTWREAWAPGKVVGVNEPSPYGYHHAREMGCDVRFSRTEEGRIGKAARLAVRAIVGFDLVHAWRNRHDMRAADVVWTHTESHGLAAAAVLACAPPGPRPSLILQTVWLVDRWRRYPVTHRWLIRRLLRRADVVTFHSSLNRHEAESLFPGVRCEIVQFGIRADEKQPPRAPRGLSLLAMGNDEHRDWATTLAVLEELPEATLRVASDNFPARFAHSRVTARAAQDNGELSKAFADADLLVLALKPNMHASGLTVLQEAVLHGLPVVATDVGGLAEYFDRTMVEYVPPGDPVAIAAAIRRLLAAPERAEDMARRAQARMSPGGISSQAYVRRHVALSRELLGHSCCSS